MWKSVISGVSFQMFRTFSALNFAEKSDTFEHG